MNAAFLFMETFAFGIFATMFFHSYRKGREAVYRLLVFSLYGVILEVITVQELGSYHYGDFLVSIFNVPLWVGLMWGVLIYLSMELTTKLGLPTLAAVCLDGLLMLNIDLSTDAIAIRLHFWNWGTQGGWFGVPYGNFFAWFFTMFFISVWWRFFKEKDMKLGLRLGASVLLSIICLSGFNLLYLFGPGEDTMSTLFLLLILGSSLAVLASTLAARKGMKRGSDAKRLRMPNLFNEFEVIPYVLPLMIHLCFLGFLILYGMYQETSSLLYISTAMTIVGAVLHSLPFLGRIRNMLVSTNLSSHSRT